MQKYDSAAREAVVELRQAQKDFGKIPDLKNNAILKANYWEKAAGEYEQAVRVIIEKNNSISAARDLPISRVTLLEQTSLKAKEAGRKAYRFNEDVNNIKIREVELKAIRDDAKGRYDIAKFKHEKLLDYAHKIRTSPQDVAKELTANPEIGRDFGSLGNWFLSATSDINKKNKVLKSTSRYIKSSNRKFFNEYAREVYPGIKGGDEASALWMANPQNRSRLASLSRNKKFMDAVTELHYGKEYRESLTGLTKSQLSRKLKIVGAAGVGLTGAVAFMSWFDDESSEVIRQTAKTTADIGTLDSTGLGAVILQDTRKALKTINEATSKTEIDFGKEPERAGPEYIKTLVQQKAILDKNLASWDTVVKSSNDQGAAIAAGESLKSYSKDLESKLNDVMKLAKIPERPGRTPEPGIAGSISGGKATREHIKSVQDYLSSKFPTVGPTGNLDRPTIRALKSLEREYDRLGNTDRYSIGGGLLVRPDTGHLIELKDLKQIDEIMKQYKR